MEFLGFLGELVLIQGLRRSMSSAVSCCWMGSAKETRLDCTRTDKIEVKKRINEFILLALLHPGDRKDLDLL